MSGAKGPIVLALDLATKTGYALMHIRKDGIGRLIDSGTIRFPGPLRERASHLERWLEDYCKRNKVTEIHFEQTHFRFVKAAAAGYTLRAVTWLVANRLGISTEGYQPSEIKRSATMRGNASKDEMIVAAKGRWGFLPQDDNEADALCLLDLATKNRI